MQRRRSAFADRESVQPFVGRPTRTARPQADLHAELFGGKPDAAVHARVFQRLTGGRPSRAASSILSLQSSYGNHYVQRVLALARHADDPTSEHPTLPPMTFKGKPSYSSFEGGCDGLNLHGKTDVAFDHTGRVEKKVVETGKDCGCKKGVQCLHVTGTLVTDYTARVTITMPPVPGGLTKCEKSKVRAFLDSVLRPHEEDHRARLMTYQGQTKNQIDVTGCGQSEIAQKVQQIGDAEDTARQAAANAKSAAIDPFVRIIDCSDCEKK